jgi:hypothetical protein
MSCEYSNSLPVNDPIYICREIKRPIAEVWAGGKTFD